MTAQTSIASRLGWTIGSYGASLAIRLTTSIALARLLGPEILGIMVIAQAVRVGAELLSDLGLEQNIVSSRHGDLAHFINTAWTLQIMRGVGLALLVLLLSPLLADIYDIPLAIFWAVSAAPLMAGLGSTSIFTLTRNLDLRKRSLFEVASEAMTLVATIVFALCLHSVWAAILGMLLGVALRAALSHALPHLPHRLTFDWAQMRGILAFSKWIMLSSLAFYVSTYFDRLYLGTVIDTPTLGTYGLAATIAGLPIILAGTLASQVIFPSIASAKNQGGSSAGELAVSRRIVLFGAAIGIGTVMAWSDVAILILYGRTYLAADWMLSLLLITTWICVLSILVQAEVLGHLGPRPVGIANSARTIALLIVLPTGFMLWGLPGAILAMPIGELARYAALTLWIRRLDRKWRVEDAVGTAVVGGVFGLWCVARHLLNA